mmetsp:Transcript_41952/g.90076  ORF Transcript_41952/g.90076 Transcript_41952/m.90076 type:complete len:262 (+) Transcript_41952:239-1024(+)
MVHGPCRPQAACDRSVLRRFSPTAVGAEASVESVGGEEGRGPGAWLESKKTISCLPSADCERLRGGCRVCSEPLSDGAEKNPGLDKPDVAVPKSDPPVLWSPSASKEASHSTSRELSAKIFRTGIPLIWRSSAMSTAPKNIFSKTAKATFESMSGRERVSSSNKTCLRSSATPSPVLSHLTKRDAKEAWSLFSEKLFTSPTKTCKTASRSNNSRHRAATSAASGSTITGKRLAAWPSSKDLLMSSGFAPMKGPRSAVKRFS